MAHPTSSTSRPPAPAIGGRVAAVLGGLTLLWGGAAAAEPLDRVSAALRVSVGQGVLEGERTWAMPGVDLVGTLRFGPERRGFVDLQLGFSPLDNHTTLSDGRMNRIAVVGGVRLGERQRIRVGALLALEDISFHADPDVLAENPGVDLLVGRGDVVPTAGLEASLDVGAVTTIGLFARAGMTRLTLFDTPTGDEGQSRLFLGGAFIELGLR